MPNEYPKSVFKLVIDAVLGMVDVRVGVIGLGVMGWRFAEPC